MEMPWRASLVTFCLCSPTAGCSTDSPETGSDTMGEMTGQTAPSDVSTTGSSSNSNTGDPSSDGSGGGQIPEPAPTQTVQYTESTADIVNPERGFFRTSDVRSAVDYSWVREGGDTLVYSYIMLDEYRSSDIPAEVFEQAEQGLQAARDASVKLILRFAYNQGPWVEGVGCGSEDAPLQWVLTHIEQAEPFLRANEDVIAVLQAGFIGCWGEWHSSTNNLLDNAEEITTALLAALPSSRMIQIRSPVYKRDIFGDPLSATEAYNGSDRSRAGHHNDCFLASETDLGTYPSDAIDMWKTYVEQDTIYTPMGGETCGVNPPRSECESATAEMKRLHFSHLNRDYHQGVLDSWEPCMHEVRTRLGYRFALRTAELAPTAKPGGNFTLAVEVDNVGWAAPFNPRPLVLVLEGPSLREEVELPIDVRLWLAGDRAQIAGRVLLPGGIPAGVYELSLWSPDASPSLRQRSEFALQFANDGVWNGVSNVLGSIEVDPDGPGGTDPDQAFGFEVQ